MRVPAGEHADAADQVDRRDDGALQAVQLGELGTAGALPWPQSQIAFAGRLPRPEPGLVDGMVAQHGRGSRPSASRSSSAPGPRGRWSATGWSGSRAAGSVERLVGERRLGRAGRGRSASCDS